jgi:hypothetical protein
MISEKEDRITPDLPGNRGGQRRSLERARGKGKNCRLRRCRSRAISPGSSNTIYLEGSLLTILAPATKSFEFTKRPKLFAV